MKKKALIAEAKATALKDDINLVKAKAEASGLGFKKEDIPPG